MCLVLVVVIDSECCLYIYMFYQHTRIWFPDQSRCCQFKNNGLKINKLYSMNQAISAKATLSETMLTLKSEYYLQSSRVYIMNQFMFERIIFCLYWKCYDDF